MTVEPDLDLNSLSAKLESEYGLSVRALEFLPLGADVRSFSYRCTDTSGNEFFVKLRSASTWVMTKLECAISPLVNQSGSRNGAEWAGFQLNVFPYVHCVDGWDYTLSVVQWRQIGEGVRALHGLVLPETALKRLPREAYSDVFRARLPAYLRTTGYRGGDAVAKSLIELLHVNKTTLLGLIDRAQALSEKLSTEQLEFVCCHGDLHSGNFLIDHNNKAHLVDWDTLSLAPKEKDLMFIGAGIGGMLDVEGGAKHFYEGYGTAEVNRDALLYFRHERIIQDVVAYGEQLLDSSEGGADRVPSLAQIVRQFEPGGVVEVACKT